MFPFWHSAIVWLSSQWDFFLEKNKFHVIQLFIAYFLIGEKKIPRHSAIKSTHPICSYPFSTDLCHIQRNRPGEEAVETVLLQWSSWRCFYRAGTFSLLFLTQLDILGRERNCWKCHGKRFGQHCNLASRSRIKKGEGTFHNPRAFNKLL